MLCDFGKRRILRLPINKTWENRGVEVITLVMVSAPIFIAPCWFRTRHADRKYRPPRMDNTAPRCKTHLLFITGGAATNSPVGTGRPASSPLDNTYGKCKTCFLHVRVGRPRSESPRRRLSTVPPHPSAPPSTTPAEPVRLSDSAHRGAVRKETRPACRPTASSPPVRTGRKNWVPGWVRVNTCGPLDSAPAED